MGGTPKDWFSTAETTMGGGELTVADDLPGTEHPQLDRSGPTIGDRLPLASGTLPQARLVAGDRVGRYVLESPLGEGAMGQVWRARDPQLDRAVAIKVVHPTITRSPDGAARLLREARAMAKLSHRNVVTVYDAGEDGDRLFVAMELVDGLTLGDVLRGAAAGRPRGWRRSLALLTEAGRGLAAAHSAGVLHRDFKPDNVLVDRAGRVCVGDFGLAAFGAVPLAGRRPRPGTMDAPADELTATGAVVGTPAFMSPEQLHGEAIDARADQFAFCVALYEALYGEHPFFGTSPVSIGALVEAIDGGIIRPPPRTDAVPRWLRAVVVRGLAAMPAARWPSMTALLAALGRGSSRVPPLLIVATAAAVLAAVLAVVVVVRADRTPVRPAPVPGTASPAVRRFDVSMATRIALSPDGRRLAMATVDRLDVRDLVTGQTWAHRNPSQVRIERVQFDGNDRVLFSHQRPVVISALALADGAVAVDVVGGDPLWAVWLGRVAAGDFMARLVDDHWELGLISASGSRTIGQVASPVQVTAVDPSGRRLALVEEGRYDGRVLVLDPDGIVARSPVLPALTSVAWLTDDRLAYATGTVDRPTIYAATLAAGELGPPRPIYGADRGWFGQLLIGGGRMLFIDSGATFRSRVIDRGPGDAGARDLDTGTVGAVLGWLDDGTFLAWNRSSGAVERHDSTGPIATTAARLDGEAANATRAGDIVIASLRRDTGRELIAVSITDGRTLWRQPPGHARAVRCAGDRQPPCFVFADGDDADRVVRPIDPATGHEGEPLAVTGRVDELAVSADGAQILVTDGSNQLRRIALATGVETPIEATISARGLAFDPRGGILVAGTSGHNQYLIIRIDGPHREVLLQSRNEILFLPRPSPDRNEVLAMGRLFLPAIYELPLAPEALR